MNSSRSGGLVGDFEYSLFAFGVTYLFELLPENEVPAHAMPSIHDLLSAVGVSSSLAA